MEDSLTRLEDIWRIVGIVSLLLCAGAEVVALFLHEGKLKKRLEFSSVALLLFYIATDIVAYTYEIKVRRMEAERADSFNKTLAATFSSSLSEFAYESRSKVESARQSKETPIVRVTLEPLGIGTVAVAMSSSNFVPFQYRYAISTDGGNTVCKSPDLPQDLYPNGTPLLVPCRFSVESLTNGNIQLQVTISAMPHAGSTGPLHQEQMAMKYKLAADKITLLRID